VLCGRQRLFPLLDELLDALGGNRNLLGEFVFVRHYRGIVKACWIELTSNRLKSWLLT
jgi:hypothetical protein